MAKDYARKFYNSKQWKETQAAYMSSKHYICERCGNIAKIVHHKTHITPENIHDVNITLNWSNLCALCHNCHQAIHGNTQTTADGLMFDENGNLVKSPRVDEKSCGPRNRAPTSENPSMSFHIKGGLQPLLNN